MRVIHKILQGCVVLIVTVRQGESMKGWMSFLKLEGLTVSWKSQASGPCGEQPDGDKS